MENNPELSTDKRSAQRLKAEMRVYHGPDLKTLLTGFTVNLSTGGLYLKTDYPLKREENLLLIFTLPGQERSISCKVRVAWINSREYPRKADLAPGAGLQFVDISLESMKAIRRFMEHNDLEPTW